MNLRRKDLGEIFAHASKQYPEECCGIVIGLKDDTSRDKVYKCTNIQNALHRQNPEEFPRDAQTAYNIDPAQMFKVHKDARDQGLSIKVIYHSHIDAGAYFSAEDKKQAFMGEELRYPHAAYLVISVTNREVTEATLFRWHPSSQEFEAVPVDAEAERGGG